MIQKVLIATAIASVLALSACQRTSYNYSQPVAPQPQPLTPAPAGQELAGLAPSSGTAACSSARKAAWEVERASVASVAADWSEEGRRSGRTLLLLHRVVVWATNPVAE